MRLKGKTAIVTGAGSGFGEGIARRFAAGRRESRRQRHQRAGRRARRARGRRASSCLGDVTKGADWAKLVQAAGASLDIVVNNAGWTHRNKPYLEVSEAEFDQVYAVNVKSVYLSACMPCRCSASAAAAASSTSPRPPACARAPASPCTTARRAR